MTDMEQIYQFILEMNKLKLVFRNTRSHPERQESTAEHSWSVSMIIMVLMAELKQEFNDIDELKAIKLALIHDIVEIYAGDAFAFDMEARKEKEVIEAEALQKLMEVNPAFGQQLHQLWHEFEEKKSLEAQIAKAADSICPIFMRLHTKQDYLPFNVSIATLEKTKFPVFAFSKTFTALFEKLKSDLLSQKLILES